MRILLAEDDEYQRYCWKKLFEDAGHQVTGVRNGRQAIVAACEEQFDLLITDMNMHPGVNGLEVIWYLSKRNTVIRKVLISSDCTLGMKAAALEFGAETVEKEHFIDWLKQARVI